MVHTCHMQHTYSQLTYTRTARIQAQIYTFFKRLAIANILYIWISWNGSSFILPLHHLAIRHCIVNAWFSHIIHLILIALAQRHTLVNLIPLNFTYRLCPWSVVLYSILRNPMWLGSRYRKTRIVITLAMGRLRRDRKEWTWRDWKCVSMRVCTDGWIPWWKREMQLNRGI